MDAASTYKALRNLHSDSYAAFVLSQKVATRSRLTGQVLSNTDAELETVKAGPSQDRLLQLQIFEPSRFEATTSRPRDLRMLPAVGAILCFRESERSASALACVLEVHRSARRPLLIQWFETGASEVQIPILLLVCGSSHLVIVLQTRWK